MFEVDCLDVRQIAVNPNPFLMLLAHMDGTNGSTTFIDSSAREHVLTAVGDAQISTAQVKFGTASYQSSNNTGWVKSIDNLEDFTFGTGDYSIDCWIYIATGVGDIFKAIFDLRGDTVSNGPFLDINRGASNAIRFAEGSSVRINTAASNVALDAWNHMAVARASGTTRLFVNGTVNGTPFVGSTNLVVHPTDGLVIGSNRGSGGSLVGHIDEVRVLKGFADYTSNFSPPTGPYS